MGAGEEAQGGRADADARGGQEVLPEGDGEAEEGDEEAGDRREAEVHQSQE